MFSQSLSGGVILVGLVDELVGLSAVGVRLTLVVADADREDGVDAGV